MRHCDAYEGEREVPIFDMCIVGSWYREFQSLLNNIEIFSSILNIWEVVYRM